MRTQVDFRRWLILSLLVLLGVFTLALAPANAAAQDRAATGFVATGALNVRSGPGPEYQIIGTSYQGHAVAVLGRSGFNSWAQVRTFTGLVGWMNAQFLTLDVPFNNLPIVPGFGGIPTPPPTIPAIGVVNTGAVNVRSGPGMNYSVITIAYQGYTFSLLGRSADNAWANVRMVDGTVGWVSFSALNITVPVGSLPVVAAPPPPTTPPPATGATAVVNTGALNVRSGPSVNFSVLEVIYNGHQVALLGRTADSSWVQVRTTRGTVGWVNASLIAPNVPISNLPVVGTPSPATNAVVTTGQLNVRSGPGIGYPALTSVSQGTQLTLIGRSATAVSPPWVQVRLTNGLVGWVNANYLYTTVPLNTLPITG
jgi:uncharacterized protein YgiM (DUF1202 family)